jgi:signal transduction histidine kinase
LPHGESLRIEPLVGDGKQNIGALVIVFYGSLPAQNTADNFWQSFGSALQDYLHPEGLYFILLASALGTLIGLLISRNLTLRLGRITRAADAWSRGKFAVAVEDRSTDEVGQLTRDLNRMAEQLQFLLTTRLSQAVVEERNRLALDLHDSVKQQIFSNALLVRAARNVLECNPQKASRHLQEAEQIAEHIQQELIELISALRPAAIANQGLVTATRAYLND